jgi:hypothetical protein
MLKNKYFMYVTHCWKGTVALVDCLGRELWYLLIAGRKELWNLLIAGRKEL